MACCPGLPNCVVQGWGVTCQQLPAVERDRFKCVLSKLWMELLLQQPQWVSAEGKSSTGPAATGCSGYSLPRLSRVFVGHSCSPEEAWLPSPGRGRL